MSLAALADGFKDVAAVLASGALEDALKRFAAANGLIDDDRALQRADRSVPAIGIVLTDRKSVV